jgi:hypothetical protein
MPPTYVKIKEIDDGSQSEAVDNISDGAADDQTDGDGAMGCRMAPLPYDEPDADRDRQSR